MSSRETPSPLPNGNSSKSFWLSEPELAGHRTTAALPSEADVVVVGSGITGASALRYLVESGKKLDIVALEAREVGSGASGRNGGQLQAVPYSRSPPIGRFEISGCDELSSYIKQHNVSCEYRPLTAVRTFWTKAGLNKITEKVNRLKKEDPEVGERISIVTDPDELSTLGVQKGCLGAILTRGSATVWPYKLVVHMVRSLVESGSINLQTNTPVTHIVQEQDKWLLHTPRGTIRTTQVILATNAYTSHLIHEFAPLIVPARGYVTALVPPAQNTTSPKLIPNAYALIAHSDKSGGDLDEDDYLLQRPYDPGPNHKGHLIFGGGHYDGTLPSIGPETADDSVVDPGAVAYLRKAVLAAVKLPGNTEGLEELDAEYTWSGIMGYSRDNIPWVGEIPGMKGVFLAAGYTGHGLPNGPMCAKAVVKMLLQGGDSELVGKALIRDGQLPEAYLLTQERMKAAMKLPSVIDDDGEVKNAPAAMKSEI